MKVALVSTLLLLLLCSTQVLTLQCYFCTGSDELECDNVQECGENEKYCKTIGSGNQVYKNCSATCIESSTTTCCKTDLC